MSLLQYNRKQLKDLTRLVNDPKHLVDGEPNWEHIGRLVFGPDGARKAKLLAAQEKLVPGEEETKESPAPPPPRPRATKKAEDLAS